MTKEKTKNQMALGPWIYPMPWLSPTTPRIDTVDDPTALRISPACSAGSVVAYEERKKTNWDSTQAVLQSATTADQSIPNIIVTGGLEQEPNAYGFDLAMLRPQLFRLQVQPR